VKVSRSGKRIVAGMAFRLEFQVHYYVVLRPSNSSSRVSRIPHALISAAPASRRKLLVAARRVVQMCAHCHAVEFLLANWLVILRCF